MPLPPFAASLSMSIMAGLGTLTLLGGLAVIAYSGPLLVRHRQARRWSEKGRGFVALTYDDGPDATTSPAVLDLLDELGAPATFYLVGFRAEQNPAVAARMRSSPHELGAHTHSHKNAWRRGPLFEWRDTHRGYTTLAATVPPDAPFRPPFGKASLPTIVAQWARGRRVDWWTSAAGDTRDDRPDPAQLAGNLLDSGGPVILMHCHHAEADRRDFVLRLTRELVSQGRSRGSRFVTVAQLTQACR